VQGTLAGFRLAETTESSSETALPKLPADLAQVDFEQPIPVDFEVGDGEHIPLLASASDVQALNVNLPTVLSMVGGTHPAVGFAQWRVQESYAQLEQARALWLPTIRGGFSYHRHDGNYQASNGTIVDVNRNSFQYGLGEGATGAGTTPRPGLTAQFHLADALFEPEVAKRVSTARKYGTVAALNEQLMQVSLAYVQLVGAHQESRIVQESRDLTTQLFKLTSDFAEAGEGLQSDADRMGTELSLAKSRLLSTQEQIDVATARLAQTASLDAGNPIFPMDTTAIPLDLVSLQGDKAPMIATGLSNRPELKESQALVSAACQRHRQEKLAPFVPSVLLGFSSTAFGGGLGNDLDNVDGRYDLDAGVAWELRNMGLGERAARRLMDQVAREVSESHTQVVFRAQQINVTRQAIESAEKSHERNVSRIRDGQGLPLEALQSLQALERARLAYLEAVTGYNESQIRLQWSLGWPITTREGN
jgi:outer membrane protein TolC